MKNQSDPPPNNQGAPETPILNIKKRFETKNKILPNTAKLLFLGWSHQGCPRKSELKIHKKRDFDAPPGLAKGPRQVKLWSQIDIRSNYLYMEFRPLY